MPPPYINLSYGHKSVQDELGYTYSNARTLRKDETTTVWRCSQRNRGCKAQLNVKNNMIVCRKYLHEYH